MLAPGGTFFVEGPLEDNASLVFYVSRAAGWLKHRLKPRRRGNFTPYHLTRTNARAQRAFFENTLRYRITWFRTFETGWPYPGRDRSLWRARSAADLLRTVVSRLAMLAARIGNAARLTLGNRFVAIVMPEPEGPA